MQGWDEDQCWTLAGITEVARSRFGVEYTLAGMDLLLHRIGWSVQVPARRAAGRRWSSSWPSNSSTSGGCGASLPAGATSSPLPCSRPPRSWSLGSRKASCLPSSPQSSTTCAAAAAAAAQVDRHELQGVAGEPFGEAVEAAQVRRQTGHAYHRCRIGGTPPPHPKPSGRKRDVRVLVSHRLQRHAGTPLRAVARPRIGMPVPSPVLRETTIIRSIEVRDRGGRFAGRSCPGRGVR